MILTKEQVKKLKELSQPLMEYLAENFHPHVKVIVECDGAEFLESKARVLTINMILINTSPL